MTITPKTLWCVFVGCAVACGNPTPAPQPPPAPGPSPEQQAAALAEEHGELQESEQQNDETLTDMEDELVSMLRQTLGQQPFKSGEPPPKAASTSIEELRGAGIILHWEPIPEREHEPIEGVKWITDSATKRLIELRDRPTTQPLTTEEQEEQRKLIAFVPQLTDLRSQGLNASIFAITSSQYVSMTQVTSLMQDVVSMTATRRLNELPFRDEDFEWVRRGLDRVHRAEVIVSTSVALAAAFQAVVEDHRDPKAIDEIAGAGLASFPVAASATPEDAHAYVAKLPEHVRTMKPRYLAWLEASLGERRFAKHRAQFEKVLDLLAGRLQAKPARELSRDLETDLARCARGLPLDPSSAVPKETCAGVRQSVLGGASPDQVAPLSPEDAAELDAVAQRQFQEMEQQLLQVSEHCARGQQPPAGGPLSPENCNAIRLAAAAGTPVETLLSRLQQADLVAGRVGAATEDLDAVLNGDLSSMLASAADLFPTDGTMRKSLVGLGALLRGDPRAALAAALDLVPGGGLVHDAIAVAGKLLGIF